MCHLCIQFEQKWEPCCCSVCIFAFVSWRHHWKTPFIKTGSEKWAISSKSKWFPFRKREHQLLHKQAWSSKSLTLHWNLELFARFLKDLSFSLLLAEWKLRRTNFRIHLDIHYPEREIQGFRLWALIGEVKGKQEMDTKNWTMDRGQPEDYVLLIFESVGNYWFSGVLIIFTEQKTIMMWIVF